ncbi:MAG: ATP-binding protein [Elusimicrobia bacterium]|nr:ATP-binding protein [Elusimicrobiota bacterium]
MQLEERNDEDVLRDSEMRYRRLFEAAQDGILILDAVTGTIADANPFIIELLGFSHEQLVNKKLWEIGAFLDFFANLEKFEELRDRGYVRYEGLPLVAADGRKLFVEFVSNAYTVNDCRVIQCNIRDNTARRQAELEKEALAVTLREKNREMEGFLYITTHDLRSPLVNIQGFSRNLGKDLKRLQELMAHAVLPKAAKGEALKLMSESVPEALGFITGSVLRMDQLITALLKISRLGRLEITARPVDMNAVLKNVLETFAYRLEKTGVEVKVESLPPCSADAGILTQFFMNIIDNCLKYRDRGRKLEITVKGKITDAHSVIYTVSDNGLGIKAADLEKIWEVFYSVQAPGEAADKGEGIGLTITKRLVERSGGRIWVESKEGAGADFFIELPAPV